MHVWVVLWQTELWVAECRSHYSHRRTTTSLLACVLLSSRHNLNRQQWLQRRRLLPSAPTFSLIWQRLSLLMSHHHQHRRSGIHRHAEVFLLIDIVIILVIFMINEHCYSSWMTFCCETLIMLVGWLCCSVNVPPLIRINPPKNAQFREYESIELPCHAVGIPTPTSVS